MQPLIALHDLITEVRLSCRHVTLPARELQSLLLIRRRNMATEMMQDKRECVWQSV